MTEYEKMMRLLDSTWPVRGQVVPCLVGPPGIGKTAAVREHAERHGCGKVVKIVASRCVPSETVGMTMPDHERRSMDIYNSMQLSSLEDGDILFLDELLEADQFVLSTLLTVIESREMADGTPLPDIQIVAATNDTIPPEQLRGNIRQRFMFMRFKIDKDQTSKYIEEQTGMLVPNDVLSMMTESSNDYNFLTPRSLTKLCLWVDATPEDQLEDVAQIINDMWRSAIGTSLVRAKRMKLKARKTPERQVRDAVKEMIGEGVIRAERGFADCTFSEMLETLQQMPEWEQIASRLAEIEIEEEEREPEGDILF